MLKSIKLKNDTYLDSSSIVHNRTLLPNLIIVESESNNNGSYIKFGDGTMICYGTHNIISTSTQTWEPIDLPCTFVGEYIVIASLSDVGQGYSTLTTGLGVRIKGQNQFWGHVKATTVPSGGLDLTIFYIAIGKWK